ncbi:4Fe-4S ferredoxin [Methanoculleus sp. Wushi-C6]|uniref:4Fe-4S ferredoxin n=1 Tax=Methanoculleus caldifontis TaxID=2651577 RepID=A0ABU3WY30_9EURY|nr:EFR1 family ferrodoxin [Methanoculleus sp. Wushi-C6]MDV2480709.1 4Fe-4S ferredoxin [Methanoculleus sp. Wushi-C6]
MKILILYFSATGNTAGIAHELRTRFTELGVTADEVDITPPAVRRDGVAIEPYDAVVFGFPVHSWRAPAVVRDWLRTLDGRQKRCSTFFTYGGFGIHPAHESTRKILTGQGFVVVSSAEFLAPHTFNLGGWKAMEGRPDTSDLEVAREYAARTLQRFAGTDQAVLGSLEATRYSDDELDAIERFRFRVVTELPSRTGRECSMCRACEEICPAEAMDAARGEADPDRCIVCLGCVAACPEQALSVNDLSASWDMKLKMEKITVAEMESKKSRIYL